MWIKRILPHSVYVSPSSYLGTLVIPIFILSIAIIVPVHLGCNLLNFLVLRHCIFPLQGWGRLMRHLRLLENVTINIDETFVKLFFTLLRARLGQRSRRLNAKRRNNRAKRFASDARSPIAPNAKRGGLNCAGENQRSDVLSALAYKRSASGARCPKQSLTLLSHRARPNKHKDCLTEWISNFE